MCNKNASQNQGSTHEMISLKLESAKTSNSFRNELDDIFKQHLSQKSEKEEFCDVTLAGVSNKIIRDHKIFLTLFSKK